MSFLIYPITCSIAKQKYTVLRVQASFEKITIYEVMLNVFNISAFTMGTVPDVCSRIYFVVEKNNLIAGEYGVFDRSLLPE